MDEQKKRGVVLYGLAGPRQQYKVLRYWAFSESPTVDEVNIAIIDIRAYDPGVEMIYIIDNYPGLKSDYTRSYKKNTIESCAIFKDILERKGRRLYID